MMAGDYPGALATVEKEQSQYAGPNSLLYYLDRGALLQRTDDYRASCQDLEQADKLIDELAGTSVSETVGSFLVNDMTLSYTGEDFEQVMINIMGELSYLYAGDLQGALVEARRVNTRLVQLSDKYNKEMIYKQDAFARYLSAFAYEAEGDYNDAYIDYKNAYQAFQWYEKHYHMPMPPEIREDLLRLSRWQGFDDEYKEWREAFGPDLPDPGRRPKKRSEVLLVVYDSLAPRKTTRWVAATVADPDGNPYTLKVAFPTFTPMPHLVDSVRVGLADGQVIEGHLFEPLDAIAVQNLEQRIGAITAKAIGRATAKFIAAYQTRKILHTQDEGVNLLVGLATNVYTFATEQADTRSWLTLPSRFHLVRISLPPGKHSLELMMQAMSGETHNQAVPVELKPGEKKVIPVFVTR
jgi:hypothetical protein